MIHVFRIFEAEVSTGGRDRSRNREASEEIRWALSGKGKRGGADEHGIQSSSARRHPKHATQLGTRQGSPGYAHPRVTGRNCEASGGSGG